MARSVLTRTLRQRVAIEAARLMAEQGIDDFLAAKKKAAQRLGLSERAALPGNAEVETALLEYRRLFMADESHTDLTQLRVVAVQTMQMLDGFRPRLVGPVLSGAITAASAVELHVFSDSSEHVAMRLMDCRIDYRLTERRVRYRAEQYEVTPVYCFAVEGTDIEVFVFPVDGERQSPLSPVDGKPMKRMADQGVLAMISAASSDSVIDRFFE